MWRHRNAHSVKALSDSRVQHECSKTSHLPTNVTATDRAKQVRANLTDSSSFQKKERKKKPHKLQRKHLWPQRNSHLMSGDVSQDKIWNHGYRIFFQFSASNSKQELTAGSVRPHTRPGQTLDRFCCFYITILHRMSKNVISVCRFISSLASVSREWKSNTGLGFQTP